MSILDGLERAGAVRRTRGDVDRRRHVLALTARGRELLAEADRVAAELDEELCASLEPADRALLTDLLAPGVAAGGRANAAGVTGGGGVGRPVEGAGRTRISGSTASASGRPRRYRLS